MPTFEKVIIDNSSTDSSYTDYESEPVRRYGTDFTINLNKNVSSNYKRHKAIAATVVIPLTGVPDEETTMTLVDAAGNSAIFEIDDLGNGAVTANAIAVDPSPSDGTGMAIEITTLVNIQPSLEITATYDDTTVTLTQNILGVGGNTTITFSNYSNWNSNVTGDLPK